jgi:hypothetical protein
MDGQGLCSATILKLAMELFPPCSAELISTAYQPWNSVFLSQQISHSRLISQKNSLPNRAFAFIDQVFVFPTAIIGLLLPFYVLLENMQIVLPTIMLF